MFLLLGLDVLNVLHHGQVRRYQTVTLLHDIIERTQDCITLPWFINDVYRSFDHPDHDLFPHRS